MKLIANPNVMFDMLPLARVACIDYLHKHEPEGDIITPTMFHSICSQRFSIEKEVADVILLLLPLKFRDIKRVPHGIKWVG